MATKRLCDICDGPMITKHAGTSAFKIYWTPDLPFWPWLSFSRSKADVCAPCMSAFLAWKQEKNK